jgi:hypothetical protein
MNMRAEIPRITPSIAKACQGVEQRRGKTFVKLEGEVEEVRDEGRREGLRAHDKALRR